MKKLTEFGNKQAQHDQAADNGDYSSRECSRKEVFIDFGIGIKIFQLAQNSVHRVVLSNDRLRPAGSYAMVDMRSTIDDTGSRFEIRP